jgi:hypothetical protein
LHCTSDFVDIVFDRTSNKKQTRETPVPANSDKTRDRILTAAERLFARHGFQRRLDARARGGGESAARAGLVSFRAKESALLARCSRDVTRR